MLIHCPHCNNAIQLLLPPPSEVPVTCPSCGSEWRTWDTETAPIRTGPARMMGRFELLHKLGQGQFGEVWSAKDPALDRFVAIKIPRKEELDESDIERFLREARAAAQLRHPNIVQVLEVNRDDKNIYIVSDLIHGATLADQLHAGWRPPHEQTAQLCLTLAEALQHAHENGVIHRDVKPANVMLDNVGKLSLMDFGLAKRNAGEVTMTVEGRILGTPAYMSPEQARGDGHNADARSDVYSLGVMLFEMLTKIRPFKGGSQLLIQQILHKEPALPRTIDKSIPIDLQTICLKMLEKNPDSRYQTAQEVADELRRWLTGKSILARPTPFYTRWGRWAERNRRMALTLGVCAALTLLLGVVGADNLRRRNEDLPVVHDVLIKTYPAGARVVCVPLDPNTGEPQGDKRVFASTLSPATMRLEAMDYLVVAEVEGHGFHEVIRHVPTTKESEVPREFAHMSWKWRNEGGLDWPPIVIPTTDSNRIEMVRLTGGQIEIIPLPGFAAPEPYRSTMLEQYPPLKRSSVVTVAPYLLAVHELTRGEAAQIIRSTCEYPSEILQEWFPTLSDCHKAIDDTMQRSPFLGSEAGPITQISNDEALRFAELAGLRLMTEEEYQFAATNGGTTLFPWGDNPDLITGFEHLPAEYDQTVKSPKVFGLFSGPGEWTSTWAKPYPTEPNIPGGADSSINRVVRGGTEQTLQTKKRGASLREFRMTSESHRLIGVRFSRSGAPPFLDSLK